LILGLAVLAAAAVVMSGYGRTRIEGSA
jgi:hypothetical protein